MSRALGLRALADEIETSLANHVDPGPNPEALKQILAACVRLAGIDSQAGAIGNRVAALAAAYYGAEGSSRRLGGTDLHFIEMRHRLLGAIRARADAYLAVARF